MSDSEDMNYGRRIILMALLVFVGIPLVVIALLVIGTELSTNPPIVARSAWLLAAAGIGRASGSIDGELGEELLLDSRRDWGPVVAPALEIRVGTTQVWPLGLNVFANLNDESQMIGAHLSVRFRVRYGRGRRRVPIGTTPRSPYRGTVTAP